MKKLLSILSALTMVMGAVSCGRKTADSSVPRSENPENEVSLLSFGSAEIEMAGDFAQLINTDKRGAYYLIFGRLESGEYCGYMTDTRFAEKRTFTLDAGQNEEVKCAAIMPGGKAAVLSVMNGHTFIRTFNGKLEADGEYDLGNVISTEDHFAELLCTDDGFYINIARHTLGYADKDGNYTGEVNVGGRTVCGIVTDRDGAPCVLMSDDVKMTLGVLENGGISEETGCVELADHVDSICTGEGEYRIAVTVTDGLYGLKADHWVKLSDFSDSDIRIHEIHDMDMVAEGEFVVMLARDSGKFELRLLSQRDIGSIKQKKIIRMANTVGGNSDPYDDRIKRFNSENEEYKAELVNYAGNGAIPAFDELSRDIISGNAPDIVRFGSSMPITSFGSADSIFVDLYELIDRDDKLSRDDFTEGFLEMQETKGRLLQIFPVFGVRSMMIKDKFAAGKTSWDYDGFEAAYRNLPENMRFSYVAAYEEKYRVFNELIDYCRFVDREKGECHFDSPEFIRAVKLIKDNGIGLSCAQAEMVDDMMSWVNYEILDFRNDRTLLQPVNISNFHDIKLYEQIYGGEPCTFIGFPTENGVSAYSYAIDGYGIMASSDIIDGAWDFLRDYLFEDDTAYQGFSGLKSRFDEQLKGECEPKTYTDPETGEEHNADLYAVYEDEQEEPTTLEMVPFTAEQAEKYRAMICGALAHPMASDSTIESILDEELTACFEGEKTAEQAAEIIQNRVTIYLSERS